MAYKPLRTLYRVFFNRVCYTINTTNEAKSKNIII